MKNELTWVLLIALWAFLGIFVYEQYSAYRTQQAIEEFVGDIQEIVEKDTAQLKQQRLVSDQAMRAKKLEQERLRSGEWEKKRKAEFDRTTACGINEDTGYCFCLNKESGSKVSVPQVECETRAREITW